MPDLDEALDELHRLPDRPPSVARSVQAVAASARRRRRRRRGTGATAAVIVAASIAVGTMALVDTEGGTEVRTVGSAPPTTEALPAPQELVADPDSSLTDGQQVRVSGPFDTSAVVGAGQCASEAVEAADPVSWCDINVPRDNLSGGGGLEFTVLRTIETSNGIVDCAERAERCLLGVRTSAGDLFAPISFDAATPPPPAPVIDVTPGEVSDGARVTVSGTGFASNSAVLLRQCAIPAAANQPTDSGASEERCDLARSVTVPVDATGQLSAEIFAYADIQTYEGWVRCEPCSLRTRASRQPSAQAPLAVRAGNSPLSPRVAIVPGGPYAPGQRVTLQGTGFQQVDDDIQVGWCAFDTATPETEVQGDPRYGNAPCAYPNEGFAVSADDEGRFRIENFPLPEGPFGFEGFADCFAPGVRCGLAWHPMEGSLPVFVTLFELRR